MGGLSRWKNGQRQGAVRWPATQGLLGSTVNGSIAGSGVASEGGNNDLRSMRSSARSVSEPGQRSTCAGLTRFSPVAAVHDACPAEAKAKGDVTSRQDTESGACLCGDAGLVTGADRRCEVRK